MLENYLIAPSLNSLFVTGIILLFIVIIIINNFKEIQNFTTYQKISILAFITVAIGIHGDLQTSNQEETLRLVKETYDLMSQKFFTHATPTLFNAGTPRPQMSSCYLVGMEDDSLEGIYNTLKDCAQISKCSGAMVLAISQACCRSFT